MKLWIGVTGNDWDRFLSRLPNVDKVNFWQPGFGGRTFDYLLPGIDGDEFD
jgi:hypothetical protein